MQKIIGLIGYPLSHSFSKDYFTHKFLHENIANYHYKNFELPNLDNFKELIQKTPNLIGLNVTIPYKETILQYVDFQDSIVAEIQATNTLVIYNDKSISAYNTDVFGFVESLKPLLKKHHKRALILGTGGASKAISFGLKQLKIDHVFVSRNPKNNNEISYQSIDKNLVENHTIIINTTPLGMFPNLDKSPPFPYTFASKNHLFYDLIYNPTKTLFLSKAEKMGCDTYNGLNMLHLQAEEAWRIWKKKSDESFKKKC